MSQTFMCRECRGEVTANSAHSLVLHALPQCALFKSLVSSANEGDFDRLIGALTVEGLVTKAIMRGGGIAFLEDGELRGIVDSSLEKLGAGSMLVKVREICTDHPEYNLRVFHNW